jgi:Spy/CpxP family protein refolding chaperone
MVSTKLNARIRKTMIWGAAGLFAAAASPAIAGGGAGSPDRMVNRMAQKLNLSDAQVQQVRQIFDAHHDQMTAQFQALRNARQTLRQATLATPVEEGAIRSAAQALAQAEGDAALLRAQVHAQIVPLLDADQQQKFATFGSGPHRAGSGHRPPSE